ncbi:MAG: hypothetical protein IPM02_08295 [Betaproteobacteria bacterium]|nr:hypothetical protein [Betaproteobacteria bacterium]
MNKKNWIRAGRAALMALLCFAGSALAQVLDTVEVTADGGNAIVRIRFGLQIQYLRVTPASSGNALRVFFQITGADDSGTANAVIEEERRAPPTDLVPKFHVRYPSQPPAVQRRIEIDFDAPVNFRIRQESNNTLAVLIPLTEEQIARLRPPKPAGVVVPPVAGMAPPQSDMDKQAAPLFEEGRAALAAGEFEKATLALNRVLNLPPNQYTQVAQELIGLAREKDGDVRRARAEYELYLKLYPDGEAATRTRQRLAALQALPVLPAGSFAARTPQTTYWGSVSQYYYGGQSRATTTTTTITPATNATTLDTLNMDRTDQSQLVNTIDLTGRYRDANWDNRVVLREQYTANFLKGKDNRQYLNNFYGDFKYLPQQLSARLGRQSATSGGVLGRFDGGTAGWGFAPHWRVNVTAGQPVDSVPGAEKKFYGASLDAENLGERWSANLFAIRQVVGSREDRTGVGGELRYFDPQRNVYSLFDYDPTFKVVNVGMVQGSWQLSPATALNFIADYRRTPTLQLTNAMLIDQTVSLDTLIAEKGLAGVRDQAKALTPLSKVFLAGITQQLSPRWQVGFDFRAASLTGTPAIGILPATPGTGTVYAYTLQAIGNGLTPLQDILVVSASHLNGKLNDAQQASIDYRFVIFKDLVVEPILRWYRQTDSLGVRLTRMTPSLKLVYRIKDRFSIEAEADMEFSRTVGPLINEDITRRFYYIGWRWDF